MPFGKYNPEISDALTFAPEVVYSPMKPGLILFPTYKFCALRAAAKAHVSPRAIPQTGFVVFMIFFSFCVFVLF
jgi:hypothetical protein